jgi:excisionase family DNA binding protein
MVAEAADKRAEAPIPAATRPTLFLTIEEAAVVSGLSAPYLRRAIRDGQLPALFKERRDWRTWRIRRKDLEAL